MLGTDGKEIKRSLCTCQNLISIVRAESGGSCAKYQFSTAEPRSRI